jgi:hypothetical protein
MAEAEIIRLTIGGPPSTTKTGTFEILRSALKSTARKWLARDGSWRKEVTMIKIGLVLVSIGIVSVIVLWPKSPAVTATPKAQSISIQELHMLASLADLPMQQIDDLSVIYPTVAEQTK